MLEWVEAVNHCVSNLLICATDETHVQVMNLELCQIM